MCVSVYVFVCLCVCVCVWTHVPDFSTKVDPIAYFTRTNNLFKKHTLTCDVTSTACSHSEYYCTFNFVPQNTLNVCVCIQERRVNNKIENTFIYGSAKLLWTSSYCDILKW